MPAPRSTRGARAQARHFGCMVRARLHAHPARTHCVPNCAHLPARQRLPVCPAALRDSASLRPVQPACESLEWRSAWQVAARPSLPPPIMARHSVLRHLHTHDPPGKAHPADAGPPDPLRRCEKNAHAMPIDSDTSVLMAADFQGISPRPFRPRGASARARTRTVPCSCTQAPAAERPVRPCVHALASPTSLSFGARAQEKWPPTPGRHASHDRRRGRCRW